MNIEPYRMVEPQTMSDAQLRAMYQQERHPTLAEALFQMTSWTLLAYTVIVLALCIW